MVFKGIFWIKPNDELIILKVKCDAFGCLLEKIPTAAVSKSGGNYNHKNAWATLPKSVTNGKGYNYYPRGRVEIRNKKATIFINYISERLKERIIFEFGLTSENGIENAVFKIDNSKHYVIASEL